MQRTWNGHVRLLRGWNEMKRRGRRVHWIFPVLWAIGCVALWSAGAPCVAQESAPAKDVPGAKTPDQGDAPATDKPATDKEGWKPLLDGKSLEGWKITDVGGQGDVTMEGGVVSLGMGATLTGITYTRDFPKCDYEFQLESRRVEGVDFFSTVTFPVGDSFCSLVVGGWGGSVVGISCVNGSDASENETTKYVRFVKGQWYRIRVVVRRDRVQAWIDDQQVVDLETARRKLSTRVEVYLCQPLGVASWVTRGELRNLRYRVLEPERGASVKESPAEESKSAPERPAAEQEKSGTGAADA